MNHLNSESGQHFLHSSSSDGNYEDDIDLVKLQLDNIEITFYYSQLSKYSILIRDKYLYPDVLERFPVELHDFQQQYNIDSNNIILFFHLLQQNFNFEENLDLSYKQCIDLFKI